MKERPIPNEWFPLVLQEQIDGEERDVDALFRDGRLVGWTYCDQIEVSSQYGPSIARHYVAPPTLDFLDALVKFGEVTGVHGFVNCSFMYSPSQGKHFLFEADPRPNAWHHMGKLFEINWLELMFPPIINESNVETTPWNIPPQGIHLRLRQRELEYAFQQKASWGRFASLIFSTRQKNSPMKYQDVPLNRAQRVRTTRLLVLEFTRCIFDLLPERSKEQLKSKGLTGLAARRILGQ